MIHLVREGSAQLRGRSHLAKLPVRDRHNARPCARRADAYDRIPVEVRSCARCRYHKCGVPRGYAGKAVFDSVWTTSARFDLARFEFHNVAHGEPEFVAIEAQERFELVVRATCHPISTTT